MQLKQKAMLEQVDTLDQECEELQRQLGEAREELQEKMTEMSEKDQENNNLAEQQVYTRVLL